MQPVTDEMLDAIIEEIDRYSDEEYEKTYEAFSNEQPVLFSYFFSEQFEVLTDEEQDYMQYVVLVIYLAIVKTLGAKPEPVSEEEIGEAEERNFALLENAPGSTLEERIEVFFEACTQEDLFNFAAEAVLEDEDDEEPELLTETGREPIFIGLITMINVLTR